MAKNKEDQPIEVDLDMSKLNSNQQIELETVLNADLERIWKAKSEGNPLIDDDGKRIRGGELNRALVWVVAREANPDLTLEEAGKIPLVSMTGKTDEE